MNKFNVKAYMAAYYTDLNAVKDDEPEKEDARYGPMNDRNKQPGETPK